MSLSSSHCPVLLAERRGACRRSSARYVYLETHGDMVDGAETVSIDTLLRHNFSVVAAFQPKMRIERVYLGCSGQVGPHACLDHCRRWRTIDFPTKPWGSWCRLVRGQGESTSMSRLNIH